MSVQVRGRWSDRLSAGSALPSVCSQHFRPAWTGPRPRSRHHDDVRGPAVNDSAPAPAPQSGEQPTPPQRTAVVTGGAAPRSIGRATAHRFAREGWAVAILDRDGEGARTVAEEVAAEHGVPTAGYAVDVTSSAAVDEVAAQIAASELPPVGALANIAGIPSPVPFLEVTDELWDR